MQSQMLKPESGFDTLRSALNEWNEHSDTERQFRQMPKTRFGIVWTKKSFGILGATVVASVAVTLLARRKLMAK